MSLDTQEEAIRLAAELMVFQLHRTCPSAFTFVQAMRYGPCADLSDYAMQRWMGMVRFEAEVVAYARWLPPVEG